MKTQSDEFIAKEEGSKRRPAELYHMWYGDLHWRYTSGDVAVVYHGYTYEPAPILRSTVTYNIKLDSNTLDITIPRVNELVARFIATVPVALIWVSVHKLNRDGPTDETTPVFMGQIKDVSFKGFNAKAKCVGFDYFFNQIVPRYRYGIRCQHTLFDPDTCGRDGLSEDDYTYTTQLSGVSSDGLTLTAGVFGNKANDYYVQGKLIFGDFKRMITFHEGTSIKIRYIIAGLRVGDIVTVVAGCNGTRLCCSNTFDNLNNCLNFEDIPLDNPASWISA